jgi:hypothetical protein
MTTIAMRCVWCARFHRDRRDLTACEAFPKGIPKAIRLMEHDHDTGKASLSQAKE